MNIRLILTALCIVGVAKSIRAQSCDDLNMHEFLDISGNCSRMFLCMRPDILGRPFAYTAEKEGGLRIERINAGIPTTIVLLQAGVFDSLDVMNISQQGNYLYLALGNHFGTNSQSPGIAIVDVTDPTTPSVTDIYRYPASNGGCGIVKAEGDYAYMGAMLHGLVILDVSDKHAIKYVSEITPDRSFPSPTPDTLKYNARGMTVRNGIVYLCFDAGGVRVINTTDKLHPRETGRYSAPEVLNRPRAYNNLVLDDTLLYVACDYCGMEVLSVADTSHISRIGWWNPWHCEGPANNWFNSGGYANEIEYLPSCKRAFLSCGRAPLEVVDLSDPTHPDSCAGYPGPINVGSWGVSLGNGYLYLSYICALIPFTSGSTGIKAVSFTPCSAGVATQTTAPEVTLTPLPASDQIMLTASTDISRSSIEVFDALGRTVSLRHSIPSAHSIRVEVNDLPEGVYFIRLSN
ncbi:MAG: T9SS type A sorting domain-containing protein [Bacteroidetes bacterium]|nr:T9SS type A sorting domain-containing protein [Bacteroidota bacterium]